MLNTSLRRAARAAAKIAAAASFVAVLAVPSHAQQPGGGGNRQMQMMMEGITLSATQQTKVDSIVASFRDKQMAMGRPQQGDTTGMGARRQMTMDRNNAIKAVLTADQAKTFDANVAKMPAGGMGGRRPGQ